MNEADLKRLFPSASASTLRRNQTCGELPGAKPEPTVCHRADGQVSGTVGNSPRYAVSIKSYRQRPIDPDNLAGKAFVDGLRYAQLIPNDTASHIHYEITQEKVATKAEERTEILITPL